MATVRIYRTWVTSVNGTHGRWVYSWEADQDITLVTPPSVYVLEGSTRTVPAGQRTEHGQSLAELRRMFRQRATVIVKTVTSW
jgi:hypothetical protein